MCQPVARGNNGHGSRLTGQQCAYGGELPRRVAELLERVRRTAVPIAGVARVAFDLVHQTMQPVGSGIALVALGDGVRRLPVARERGIEISEQTNTRKGDFGTLIKAEVFTSADWFNIMSYDDFNTTVPFRHHSDLTLANTSLNYWITTRGMPREKAVRGFPA